MGTDVQGVISRGREGAGRPAVFFPFREFVISRQTTFTNGTTNYTPALAEMAIMENLITDT